MHPHALVNLPTNKHECSNVHKTSPQTLNHEVALLALPPLLTKHHAMTCALNLQQEQRKKRREHTRKSENKRERGL